MTVRGGTPSSSSSRSTSSCASRSWMTSVRSCSVRHPDVLAEGMVLRVAAAGSRAEVVEPGLPDRPHHVVLGQFESISCSASSRVPLLGEQRRLVRVQRDGGHDGRLGAGRLDGPARALDVAAHLHDPGDADGRGAVERVVDVDEQTALDAVVEVAVIVDHGRRQRFRGVRPRPVSARHAVSIRGKRLGTLVTVDPSRRVRPTSRRRRCAGRPVAPERRLGTQRRPQRGRRLGHHRVEQHRKGPQPLGRGDEDGGEPPPSAAASCSSLASFHGACSVR